MESIMPLLLILSGIVSGLMLPGICREIENLETKRARRRARQAAESAESPDKGFPDRW